MLTNVEADHLDFYGVRRRGRLVRRYLSGIDGPKVLLTGRPGPGPPDGFYKHDDLRDWPRGPVPGGGRGRRWRAAAVWCGGRCPTSAVACRCGHARNACAARRHRLAGHARTPFEPQSRSPRPFSGGQAPLRPSGRWRRPSSTTTRTLRPGGLLNAQAANNSDGFDVHRRRVPTQPFNPDGKCVFDYQGLSKRGRGSSHRHLPIQSSTVTEASPAREVSCVCFWTMQWSSQAWISVFIPEQFRPGVSIGWRLRSDRHNGLQQQSGR